MALNSDGRLITLKEAERSHRGLQALFRDAAKNDNTLLVCFLGTFSASLCKLNRAPMNNECCGGFPSSIATGKDLFLLLHNQLAHIMAEVGTNSKIKLMDKFYDFIKV